MMYDPVPPDFTQKAKELHQAALCRHYKCSDAKIRRWLRDADVKAAEPKRGPSCNRRPMPDDFAKKAPTMTKVELRAHYSTNDNAINRWLAEAGVSSKRHKSPGGFKFSRTPGISNIAKLTNYTIYDDAANILRKYGPVYRCDDNGIANHKGKFWRIGSVIATNDELLKRASRKR